jgi:UDP-N-acetylmuramoyl-tripeptide--D-alanyl-D-alanine ligase|tara:strand:- start:28465 stop:29838 length:1374 start_codon:yes stop_codon:yes gene_type:complete
MSKKNKLANILMEDFIKDYKKILYLDPKLKAKNFRNISTDSRKIEKGDIFVALDGENFKGNQFIPDALNKGAEFCISSERNKFPKQIIVDSTLSFIQDLASYIINKNKNLKVFGITGTNGKTSTKEILNKILSLKYNVLSTEGNYNNQIGMPLTILNLEEENEVLILEMGTNSVGEIEKLAEIARPDFAIITNIGKGHTEGLLNKENIFKEKSNITKYFSTESTFSFNLDDKFLANFYSKLECEKITFGITSDAEIRACNISSTFSSFDLNYKGTSLPVKIKSPGINNIYNSLASASLGIKAGMELSQIVEAIGGFEGINNRFKITELKKGNIIIDDTYNANPDSMLRAIEMTNKIFPKKRKIAILGSMLELGESSSIEHQSISSQIKANKFDQLYAYGDHSDDYVKNLDLSTVFIRLYDHSEIKKYIDLNSLDNTVILVKGSRGMKMEKIFNFLGL